MRVIVVEPFNMERHRSRFLGVTCVTQNFLNHELHVIATSSVSRYVRKYMVLGTHLIALDRPTTQSICIDFYFYIHFNF